MNIGEWLADAKQRLAGSDPQETAMSVQALLGSVLGKPRAWLLAHPETWLDKAQQIQLRSALAQLAQGTPLPYLTGMQEFYGLAFAVSPAVLIPRPETELLVEQALAWLAKHPTRRRAADVGTGSGCIAVTLTHHCPDLQVTAVDFSWEALQVARGNIQRHAVQPQVNLLWGNLLSAAAGPFDLVCANLPYIPTATLPELAVTRYEPALALDGGPDGLRLVARLLADSPRWLAPGGLLLLEVEAGHGESGPQLALDLLPGAQVVMIDDWAGLPRLLRIQFPG